MVQAVFGSITLIYTPSGMQSIPAVQIAPARKQIRVDSFGFLFRQEATSSM